jgi:hypothetical protein
MKKLSILLASFLTAGIFTLISCTKTGQEGPAGQNGATGATGPAGPVLYGTITGSIIMDNIYGVQVTNDYTGGYIVLKNSATNATVDSVIADSAGVYTMSNVPTGSYNMYCVYSGYGVTQHQNLPFVSGTLQVDNKIAGIPTFTVSTAADSIRHKTSMNYLYGTITADPNGARTLLVFIGSTSSPTSAPGNYTFTDNVVIPADSTNFTITTPLVNFYANGFAHGSNAYFAIYGAANNYTYGEYTDFANGQTGYTAISANPYSAIVGVIVP